MSPAARRVNVVGCESGSGVGGTGVGVVVTTGRGVFVGSDFGEVVGMGDSGRSSCCSHDEQEVKNIRIINKKTIKFV